jgi:putative transposase
LGVAVSAVVRLAKGSGVRAAAYRDRLAAPALSRPLAQLSQQGRPGRPTIAKEVRELIQAMWQANPTWGSPRIVGELRKVGIKVTKPTVEKYRIRPPKPPSPTWKAFLTHHVQDLVALDFFVVPTVTHHVLFVLLILAHERRRVVHFNITEHPTAQWTAQQVVDAFPWDEAPR